MHEGFAFTVYQLGTYGTYLLGYQGTKQLSRVSNTGRVILNGILVQQICSCTVSQNQSICSCAVVIGGREALVMQASCAAGCNNNNLCSCDQVLICLHILENRTCYLALLIFDQLNRGSKIYNRNATIDDFIAQYTHDLCTRVIGTGMHSLSGSTAAVGGYHGAIRVLIEHNTQIVQPLNGFRCFHNQFG